MSNGYVKLRLYLFQIIDRRLRSWRQAWQLQIVSAQDYHQRADSNRFRLLPTDAHRGVMYDRAGRLLVRNVPSFVVSVIPSALPEKGTEERAAVIRRVSELLDLPLDPEPTLADIPETPATEAPDDAASEPDGVASEDIATPDDAAGEGGDDAAEDSGDEPRKKSIEEIIAERTTGLYPVNPHEPLRIATNVDRDVAFILDEEQLHLPGVVVGWCRAREYLDGPLMAHILGYMGRIPEERVDAYLEDTSYLYEPDDVVGLAGLEATQEALLRGQKGQKHVEVDAFEREVAVISQQPPRQGLNLKLTIDEDLQRVTEEALREWMEKANAPSGVVVALDPRDGAVLAMVSLPSFDNNLFSGGISYEDYERLSSDKRRPLINQAVSGMFPPGSTFARAGDGCPRRGHHHRATRFGCAGTLYLPNRFAPSDTSLAQPFVCWRRGGHGSLNVVGGIANSCNIFFYQVAGGYGGFEGLGIGALGKWALNYGFGEPTGIELTGEVSGLVPSDKWKRHTYGESWTTGDTYNAAIGQGFVLATPLQVANMTATVANWGTVMRPQLVYQVMDSDGNVIQQLEPDPIRELGASAHTWTWCRGILDARARYGSSARVPVPWRPGGHRRVRRVWRPGPVDHRCLWNLRNTPGSAFAPYDEPEIAWPVPVRGDEGSRVAAPSRRRSCGPTLAFPTRTLHRPHRERADRLDANSRVRGSTEPPAQDRAHPMENRPP